MPHLTLGFLSLPDLAPIELIEAAAAGGFRSLGMRITGRLVSDPSPGIVGNGQVLRELRQRLDGHGLRLSNIAAFHLRPGVGRDAYMPVFEAAATLGAATLIANGYDEDEARFTALLGELGPEAVAHGIRIALELVPYSEVKTLAVAERLVGGCGSNNVGLLLDNLHLARSGGIPADIARLDPARIVYAQLCDAPSTLPAGTDLPTEARSGRLYPGDGGLPVAEFVAALPVGLEIEVELPCAAEAHLPGTERARRLKTALTAWLAAHGSTTERPGGLH